MKITRDWNGRLVLVLADPLPGWLRWLAWRVLPYSLKVTHRISYLPCIRYHLVGFDIYEPFHYGWRSP